MKEIPIAAFLALAGLAIGVKPLTPAK